MSAASLPLTSLLSAGACLKLAFGISLLVHGALFTVSFVRPPEPDHSRLKAPGLEVVLVNARHRAAPEKAEVLAQANLDGGGNVSHDARASSPVIPQLQQRDGDALVNATRQQHVTPDTRHRVLTQVATDARLRIPDATRQQQPEPTPERRSGHDLLDSAAAMARLEAQIERDLNEYARRPRRTSIGSRAAEYRFARYIEDWRLKIERVGTLNYPAEAKGRIYGSVMALVSVRADGSVESVQILRSSGKPVLDEAVERIVRLSAPFPPFDADIRRDTDILEIARTWTFTNQSEVQTR